MTQVIDPWIRKVEDTLQQAKIIPMWAGFPPFPWKEAGAQLSSLFQVKNFKLSAQQAEWQEKEKLLSGMGDHPFVTSFILTPLSGTGYFVMPHEDMAKLSSYLLTKDHSFKGFSDRALKEGFYTFVILRALQVLDTLHPFGDLSCKLTEYSSLPKEGAYCIDLSIAINSLKLWARLICPKELHEVFLDYFKHTKHSVLTEEMAKQTEVTVCIEIGTTILEEEQWEKAQNGDFIVLDRCMFDPVSNKGSGSLTLNTIPLFQVKIKEEEVKILDHALSQAEEKEPLMSLSVEAGRAVISVEKLLQLKHGNVLELLIKPEQGVDLTIKGKKVASGELLKLGEVLGVRILHMD